MRVTYGDFIKLVEKIESVNGQILIEEWKNLAIEEAWERFRPMPLTKELVLGLMEDMASYFQKALSGISTDELYFLIANDGRKFLIEIRKVAKKCGLNISIEESDISITLTEELVKSGYVNVVEQ